MIMNDRAAEIQDEISGLSLPEATNKLEKEEMCVRVMQKDGVCYFGTCDYRTDRVNVEVDSDKVVRVLGIG